MGSNASRINETAVSGQKNDLFNSSNPDPRSPTPDITRTPLQNKNVGKHNITKNVDLRKTFESAERGEEKLIHNNPILSAVIKNHLQSYDPRSPTQDFERTPIVLPSKVNNKEFNDGSPCLVNSNIDYNDSCGNINDQGPNIILPKNLCFGFNDMSLNDTLIEPEEPLGSSTVSNEVIEKNISNNNFEKPTELLETNFDYVENNNDEFEVSDENIPEMNYEVEEIEALHKISLFKILNEDPRSPSTGIDRTPIVVVAKFEGTNEINVEKMSDDTLIKALQNTNDELRQNCKPSDYKEEVLIYEDGSRHLEDTPKKSIQLGGPRTPLSCMKNKTDSSLSKSASTLYDSKTQINTSKLQRRVSHIPRLKSLSKTKLVSTGSCVSLKNISKVSVINGDCENTPPHSHRDRWDKDSSIIL